MCAQTIAAEKFTPLRRWRTNSMKLSKEWFSRVRTNSCEAIEIKPCIVDLTLISLRSLDRPCSPHPKRKWLISVLRHSNDVPKDWIDTHWLQVLL